MLSSTTTAVNIINEWAEGEGVNDSGGGGNIDYIDGGGGGGNDVNITSFFLSFWKSEIFGRFAAELRGVAYDLAEFIDKTLIFGLDSTINR